MLYRRRRVEQKTWGERMKNAAVTKLYESKTRIPPSPSSFWIHVTVACLPGTFWLVSVHVTFPSLSGEGVVSVHVRPCWPWQSPPQRVRRAETGWTCRDVHSNVTLSSALCTKMAAVSGPSAESRNGEIRLQRPVMTQFKYRENNNSCKSQWSLLS